MPPTILSPAPASGTHALAHHSLRMQQAMAAAGDRAYVIFPAPADGVVGELPPDWYALPSSGSLHHTVAAQMDQLHSSCLLWQYTPTAWQTKGLPMHLPGLLRQLRAAGIEQWVFFHEVAVRTSGYGLRQKLLGHAQLRIARQMKGLANRQFTSIPLYAGYFAEPQPLLVPIAPNILPVKDNGLIREPLSAFCFTNRLNESLLQALVHTPWTLTVAGKGDSRRWLHLQQVADRLGLQHRIQWHGEVAAEVLSRLMQQSSLLLQPEPLHRGNEGGISFKNGTLSAALAHGMAVVSVAGDMTQTEYLRHGENCWLLGNGYAGSWQTALQTLAVDPLLVMRLAAAGNVLYNHYLSWEQTLAYMFGNHRFEPKP